jgi:hypothetical protein
MNLIVQGNYLTRERAIKMQSAQKRETGKYLQVMKFLRHQAQEMGKGREFEVSGLKFVIFLKRNFKA